MGGKRG
ncbi:hypothetical protein HaLaN_13660, partial [Haematococcus lacustris]